MKSILLIRFIYLISLLWVFINLHSCYPNKSALIKYILPLPTTFVGATILESGGSTDLFEGITTDTYTIVLNSQPTESVTIILSFEANQVIVNNTSTGTIQLSFTTSNWNLPQTISVRAIYDNVVEGNYKSPITHSVPSNNPFISTKQIGTVVANITDNQGSRLTSSFQSGTVTIGGTNPLVVTLATTVNSSKSYVYCNFQITNSALERATTCQLATNGASVSIESGNAFSGTIVNWYVVEFTTGSFVQRGSNSFLSSESVQTITFPTAVDLNRSFAILYSRTIDTNNNNDEDRTLRFRFLTSTSFEVIRNETGIAVNYEWQVIQLDGAKVQSGISTIANGQTSVTASISSVNLSNSFILMSSAFGAGTDGVEANSYVRASYSSTTGLLFSRTGNNDTVDISWFAIEMIDGTTVQSGTSNVASGTSSSTSTLNTVDTTKTMIVSSYQIEASFIGATSDQDSGTFSSFFLNPTTIQFDRSVADVNACIISWYAVQYQ